MADINVIVLPDGTEYPVSDYYLPVAISNPTDGQVLKYDATNQVWYNGDDAEGSSVFYGTSAPTSQLGVNGNLYVKYTEGTGGASDTVDALYVKLDGDWCQISTGGGGGTTDYSDIANKPQINSVELSGNKSLDDLGIQPSEISKTASGSIVTFADGGDNIPVKSFECEIVAQQASGTPTPSSPLPITGFSQADIPNAEKYIRVIPTTPNTYTQNGITLKTLSNGRIEINGTATADVAIEFDCVDFTIFSENSRTIKFNNDFIGGNIDFYNGATRVDGWTLNTLNRSHTNFNLLAGKEIKSIRFIVSSGETITNGSLMIEFIVTDTATTYTVAFGQTIYGGKLIYANGKWFIRATHEIVDLGSLSWDSSTSGTSDIWRTSSPTNCKGYADDVVPTNILAEKYVASSVDKIYSSTAPNNAFAIRQSQNYIHVMRTDSNTPTGNLVYELATPIIIPLTSSAKIKTLPGVNNIFSNTGDSTLKYFTNDADGIEELINTSETSAENTTIDDTNLAYEADNVQEAFEKITKSLTWAEYQALSEEEKNNGTAYFITDVNGDGQNFQPVIYSEEEREIGVWTDGKPLYEKTISFGALPSSGEKSVAHGISNLERVVSCMALATNVNNVSIQIPYVNAGTDRVGTYVTTTNIVIGVSTNLSSYTYTIVTIRYTKTTDVAGSGTWTPQGVPAVHHSTDEHVVGTWIDGSTIYEKTFIANGLTGDVRGWTYFADLLGVDTVIEYNGSAHLSDGSNVELGYYIIVNWVNNTLKYYCKEFNTLTFDLKLTIRYTKSS